MSDMMKEGVRRGQRSVVGGGGGIRNKYQN